MLKLTWARAAAWRARRHHLDRRARSGSLLAVASRLCGLHAQVMSCAELTAWARIDNLRRNAVQRALWQDRTLVKTWAMRGTLHLLPSEELPVWHAALAASRRYLKPKQWMTYLGITIEELDRLTEAVATALEGRLLTREQLAEEVGRLMGSAHYGTKLAESSWGTILRPAAFSGRLCFGPNLGQRVQFTHPITWLKGAKPKKVHKNAQSAPETIARRFLDANGPATVHDLARWWNGGGVTQARKWIAALGEEVTPVDLEGSPAWILTKHAREIHDQPPLRSVRLLPGFDQYVLAASHHAEKLIRGGTRAQIFRPQGWISPVLLVNGRMEGIWRHEIKGSRVEVAIDPFITQPAWVRRAVAEEAERLAAFLGAGLQLTWKQN